MWNSRFYWSDKFDYKHLQAPTDFKMPLGYPDVVVRAITEWYADYQLSLTQPCAWRIE